jgi:hypothetical protein
MAVMPVQDDVMAFLDGQWLATPLFEMLSLSATYSPSVSGGIKLSNSASILNSVMTDAGSKETSLVI